MIHGRLSLMLGARPVLDSVTPSCEGRPPAFQASRATRATKSAVASAAWLEGPVVRYPIYGRAERPAFPAPLLGSAAPLSLGVALRPLSGEEFIQNSGAWRGEIAK